MAFSELFISALMESAPKEDAERSKRASKATDLGAYAKAVWAAKGLEAKRKAALVVVSHMTAGKQAKFRDLVNAAKDEKRLDSLISNMMLSGEGKGVM